MRIGRTLMFGTFLCAVASTTAQAQMLTGYSADTGPAPEVQTASLTRPMLTGPEVQVFPLEPAAPIADVPSLMAPVPETPSTIPLASYKGAHEVRDLQPGVMAAATPAPATISGSQELPVDFEADNLQHDEAGRTITATGNVQLVQEKKILRAQKIVYDLASETAHAEGNVVLSDVNGDVYFAERVQLTGQMREGVATKVQAYLGQGGRFTASEIQKMADGSMKLKDAAYTPCECGNDDEGDPAWEIKAKEIDYDKPDGRIKYKHAKFEIYGVPVMYTPYLSHGDGREKQKSGLLTPGLGFNSQLGYQVTNQYYWAIGPDRDATAGVMLTSKKNPVGLVEYRQKFANAEFTMSGSGTSSSRQDRVNGVETTHKEEARGHLFSNGRWDINNKWRTGLDLEVASDDQYLRQYDFSNEDVLENQLYVERFSGRNYAVGRVLAFQDLRVDETDRDQPNVLPEIVASFTGEPNKMLGGRWNVEASMLGLMREGNEQDMGRGVLTAGWQRKLVSQTGLVGTIDVSARGDVYKVKDRDVAVLNPALDTDGSETRFFPQAHLVASYPVAKSFERSQMTIEPVVGLTIAPNVNAEDNSIPNEDSQDAQIDALNLFHPSRFPGKDLIEDQSRVTYGVRTGLYGYQGSYLDVFAGQSYRLNSADNPFPAGSGLDSQTSDLVGQIAGIYAGQYGMNYRFQLASDNLSSQRHEFDGYANWERFALNTRYLYATSLENTNIDESREQVEGIASVDLTKNLRFNTGALYDLGEDSGLRKAAVGLDFIGCCMSFSLLAERNLTTDSSGDNGTEIKFRLGLARLGQIATSGSSYWTNRRMTPD